MTSAVVICFVVYFVSAASGFLFGGPDWNDLKSKWHVDPNNDEGGFESMPRTKASAIADNWMQLSPFSDSGNCGERFYTDNDFARVIIFDRNGFIAGFQSGIPDDLGSGYPTSEVSNFFQHDAARSMNFITAYFVDPQIICGRGRTQDEFDADGTGTMLGIQNGATTFNILHIPNDESGMANVGFSHGQCFWTMGEHYWASTAGAVIQTMNCDTMYPMFILYNGGKLNGFGWAMFGETHSPRFEHFTSNSSAAVFQNFMVTPVPDCLYNQPHFTTLHIYMTDSPWSNFC